MRIRLEVELKVFTFLEAGAQVRKVSNRCKFRVGANQLSRPEGQPKLTQ